MARTLATMMWAAKCACNLEFHHIKSHSGHPWNEFADVACTAAASYKHLSLVPILPVDFAQVAGDVLDWVFLHWTDSAQQAQYHENVWDVELSMGFGGGVCHLM
eukprot:9246034-Karenia_brevis.AAC.1